MDGFVERMMIKFRTGVARKASKVKVQASNLLFSDAGHKWTTIRRIECFDAAGKNAKNLSVSHRGHLQSPLL